MYVFIRKLEGKVTYLSESLKQFQNIETKFFKRCLTYNLNHTIFLTFKVFMENLLNRQTEIRAQFCFLKNVFENFNLGICMIESFTTILMPFLDLKTPLIAILLLSKKIKLI